MASKHIFVAACSVAVIIATSLGCYSMYHDIKRVKIFLNSDLSALTRNEGQVQYRYPKNYGKAEYCNLYVYVNIETGATIESDGANAELDAHVGWTKIIKQGLKDRCPNKGDGCNPYSCQEVPY